MRYKKQYTKDRYNKPLVSVIMPVYNAGVFLVDAIESVLDQSYKNFELIAVDDGSTDGSWDILQRYAKRYKKIRVYKSTRNQGLSYAANTGIKKAKGEYLARFDADDTMPKSRFEKQVKFLQDNPLTVAVGGQCVMIDKSGNRIGKKTFPTNDKQIREMAFYTMSLQAGTMMINRRLIPKKFHYYSAQYRYTEDHDLLFKLFQFGRVANLADTLLYYRQHNGNSTRISNVKSVFHSIISIRWKAVKRGYVPTIKGFLINILQYITVAILPNSLVPVVYFLVRGMKSLSATVPKTPIVSFPRFYRVLQARFL